MQNSIPQPIPLCWIPREEALEKEPINVLLQQVLTSGLWNITPELMEKIFCIPNKNDKIALFKDFTPNLDMPLIAYVDLQNDKLCVILNKPRIAKKDIENECKKLFEDHLYLLFGEKVKYFFDEISFKLIGKCDFLTDNFTFSNIKNNKVMYTVESIILADNDGDEIAIPYGTEINEPFIFVANTPLSKLSPWILSKNALNYSYEKMLLESDSLRTELPILEKSLLTDVNKGHWDLFQPKTTNAPTHHYSFFPIEYNFIPRNPLNDVQSNSLVSIDFGTSSTVVAIRNEDRSIMLQRIGMQSPTQKAEAKHFQNPTVLEFLNYTSFMESWTAVPYRPFTRWADVCCSHKAKNEMYSTTADVKITNSGLASLKTWARRKKSDAPLRLRDQQDREITLPSLTTHDYDTISENFAHENLNPIELYAYFIGLNLNNQIYYGGRIFQEYYLTFPIKFDRATRDGILYSFRRGLMRSLPPALAYTPNWIEDNFIVEEYASEPTAYAAAALSEIQEIQATADGVAFGVFDFGGGTTDFSFGLYRLATAPEAEDDGYEVVLDILDTAGDENLGGEHLLQGLATYIIEKNADILLEKKIPFTFPPYTHFHGQEGLMDFGSIAYCNTTKLCEALRSFWEDGILPVDENNGNLSFSFDNKANENIGGIPLIVCIEDLKDYLIARIGKGVRAFFTAYAQAFKRENILHPDKFHVLLAGNSCRSPFVEAAFNLVLDEIKNQKTALEGIRDAIVLHPPLQADENDFNKPTMKTGVALGLLKIAPGESLGVVERLHSAKESPFRYSVGRFISGILSPTLERNSSYGQWHELGKVRTNGMDVIGFSLLPEALEGKVAQDNCLCLRHRWDKKYAGRKILIQAHAPDTIALALANEDNAPDESTISYYPLA